MKFEHWLAHAELNDETLTALIESAKKVYHGTKEEKAAT